MYYRDALEWPGLATELQDPLQNKNEVLSSKNFKIFEMMIVEDLIKHRAMLSVGGPSLVMAVQSHQSLGNYFFSTKIRLMRKCELQSQMKT